MTTPGRLPIFAVGAVALFAAAASLWVGVSLRGLRSDAELARQSSQRQMSEILGKLDLVRSELVPPGQEALVPVDPLGGLELKKASDIVDRFARLSPQATIEEVAPVLAEVDQWIYAPDEEGAANRKLQSVTDALRGLIEVEIGRQLRLAIDAPNGKVATKTLEHVNDLLGLYPAPRTAEHRTKLKQLTEQILDTSRRVGDIRRLRYNEWAISKLEVGLQAYHDNKKLVGKDDEALVESCVRELKDIDPAFLEPVVMDLYTHVLGLTVNQISEDNRIKLATALMDASTKRASPSDY